MTKAAFGGVFRGGWHLAAMAALALAALLPLAATASSTAELRVTAVVLKIARVQVLSQPPDVKVTETDIARGYVEVPAPMQVAVRSNTARGYLLAFETQSGFLRQAHVRGLSQPIQLGASGGVVQQQATAPGTREARMTLDFRFDLAEGTRPGTYPWPVHLSAEPL
jgi:hypothetical protein